MEYGEMRVWPSQTPDGSVRIQQSTPLTAALTDLSGGMEETCEAANYSHKCLFLLDGVKNCDNCSLMW